MDTEQETRVLVVFFFWYKQYIHHKHIFPKEIPTEIYTELAIIIIDALKTPQNQKQIQKPPKNR